MIVGRAILGILFFCALSWALSSDRRRVPWRVVAFGVGLQFLLAGVLLGTTGGRKLFESLAAVAQKVISQVEPGARLVFGSLSDPTGDWGYVFAFAGNGLAVILFFSALMAVLYHLGVMQTLIWLAARVMNKLLRVSGAESMAMAANVFVGQTEAPLVVRPYIERMTRSELNALMTGGFATIAGTVLAVYMGFVGEELAPHLLSASVLSAPAAFVIAKLMVPETEETETGSGVELRFERSAGNLIEAAANGTSDGLKLALNVAAMLIAFTGLVHLIDWILISVGELAGISGLSLSRIFGWVFAPFAWFIGIEGWHDCQLFGSLLGTKIAVTEFIALGDLRQLMLAGEGGGFEHVRTPRIAAYALCGFANFASIGVQIGGITPLAPTRRADIAGLAFKAMIGGAFASWMTATIAGIFL